MGREPYQPLSELISKIEQCSSKSLASLEDSLALAKPISTESPTIISLDFTELIASAVTT